MTPEYRCDRCDFCQKRTHEVIPCRNCDRSTCETCAADWDPEPPCRARCLACKREAIEMEADMAECQWE